MKALHMGPNMNEWRCYTWDLIWIGALFCKVQMDKFFFYTKIYFLTATFHSSCQQNKRKIDWKIWVVSWEHSVSLHCRQTKTTDFTILTLTKLHPKGAMYLWARNCLTRIHRLIAGSLTLKFSFYIFSNISFNYCYIIIKYFP